MLQLPLSIRKSLKRMGLPEIPLPPEDLSKEIRVARIQRLTAESKLQSTETYLGAEVAAVRERLQGSEEYAQQVIKALRRGKS